MYTCIFEIDMISQYDVANTCNILHANTVKLQLSSFVLAKPRDTKI